MHGSAMGGRERESERRWGEEGEKEREGGRERVGRDLHTLSS